MSTEILEYTKVEEIPKIVSELEASYFSGITLDLEFRKQQLLALYRLIKENTAALVDAMKKDLNKSEFESLMSEIMGVEYEIGYQLANFEKWLVSEKPDLSYQPGYAGADIRVEKVPQGVIISVSPWNYPFRLTMLPLVGMIAAGNVVVVKQSEVSQHTTALLSRLLGQYVDNRILKIVNGGPKETGVLLEQKADHICYTGSGAVGKIMVTAAAKHLAKVTLELGGKSPVIVYGLEKQDLDIAARRIIWGKLINCGQTCLGVDYILVEKNLREYLVKQLVAAVKEFYTENPKASPDYGRIIAQRHYDRIFNLVSGSKGDVVLGNIKDWDRETLYIPPTIVDKVEFGDSLLSEEIFGPILPVVSIDSISQALTYVNQNDHPLAIYCFTNDSEVKSAVSKFTRSGSLVFNDTMMHSGCHSVPFGGVGPSGTGAYMGKASIDNFSHHKTVMVSKLHSLDQKLDKLYH
ncbi:hypothetical protein BB560_002592 [Smittium megazygosporum]|uniref:Aldehyde dehydrogenase n=1 Tax=Smittium megazygosporum TaxID=133381 RepID=A0A2T9ZED4_9FUNG|nr:hypothetical protein BB560_002592 [Smittium megazygosporum]